ncbi:MAG: NADH:ubiquinone oxidoreductase, NADH-binding subunit [Nocardioidaceae bacterium]|nr:NADH:ubiquinone oxidoreductase, NADH-binding subunit [Nocardioidaceae bacterium]
MTALTLDSARLLGIPPAEPLPTLTATDLVTLVERAGLTGRGGAGFPTARKLAAVRASGRTPVVLGNAMEGEHLSHKDAELLTVSPGLVLDGLVLVGRALGARRLVLAVGHRIDAEPVRRAAGGRGVEVLSLAGGFVAGQESALVDRVNGGPGRPAGPRRPVWRHGVDGEPTFVANAETLAQLALLARRGPGWFRSAGTDSEPGTMLVTVSGSSPDLLRRPVVLEVPLGTPVGDVLDRVGVGRPQVRAVLVGGYHGAWLPGSAVDTPLSRAGLAPWDAAPGAGILHVLDHRHCPLRVSADVAAYLGREVVGQCGPCVNGLPRMAQTLDLLAGPRPDAGVVAEVDRLRRLVEGRGACAHPDGTARFVASTLRVFAGHVEAHLAGDCRAHGGAR